MESSHVVSMEPEMATHIDIVKRLPHPGGNKSLLRVKTKNKKLADLQVLLKLKAE